MTGVDPAIYRKAADVIRTGGLCKGIFSNGSAHCTVGALMTATGGDIWGNTDTVDAYTEQLTELIGSNTDGATPWGHLARWNDRERTTAEDVIALLEQAAEKAEADQ